MMKKIDPKVKNMFKFLASTLGGLGLVLYLYIRVSGEYNFFSLLGQLVLFLVAWRSVLFIQRRYIQKAKKPAEYGKWAIIIDNGSEISTQFASRLAQEKMSIFLISSSKESLFEKTSVLFTRFGVQAETMLHNFSKQNTTDHETFYKDFEKLCQRLESDGGIGVFVNDLVNPPNHKLESYREDLSLSDIENKVTSTIYASVLLLSTVFKSMKSRKSGAIVNISNARGHFPSPYSSLQSASNTFLTQFSRSMHIESWDVGVDFLVLTPFEVFNKLGKYETVELVDYALNQFGKLYVWQMTGSFLSVIAEHLFIYNPFSGEQFRKSQEKAYQENKLNK